jgi:CheY-like chemotaxis protein
VDHRLRPGRARALRCAQLRARRARSFARRLNGLEAARRIRELPLAIRPTIIALTGWGDEADRKRSEQAGIDEHLVKPVELQALNPVLDRSG